MHDGSHQLGVKNCSMFKSLNLIISDILELEADCDASLPAESKLEMLEWLKYMNYGIHSLASKNTSPFGSILDSLRIQLSCL